MRDFHLPGRSAVYANGAMAATSHPLAAKVALDLMGAGGNAVDAAIGAAVLLGICEPHATGLGGDAFAMIRRPDGTLVGLNGSGRAPAAASPDALRDAGVIPDDSAHAVTVPGAVDAFCRLSSDHGALPLAQVLAPAIRYAEAGVPVAPRVAFDHALRGERLSGVARDYYLEDGVPLPVGAPFRAPGQAEVLRQVAEHGRAGFYEGPVARDMVSSLRDLGGVHTEEDFAATACAYVTPLSALYRGARLWELPPNGQGATALLMAAILARFDLAGMDPWGPERAHVEAEAAKLAYAERDRLLGDPDTTDPAPFLSADRADALAARIRMDAVLPDPVAPDAVHRDTVLVITADAAGTMVSMIYSLFHAFGSGLASRRYGILFHNRGAAFALTPGHPNELAPGRRPLHTIIPAVADLPDGGAMAFGVMGGHYQAQGHVRTLSNMLDFRLDPQAAIDGPRSFYDRGRLMLERGYGQGTRDWLTARGHVTDTPDAPIGGAQAIVTRPDGLRIGASDPRKDGCALGA